MSSDYTILQREIGYTFNNIELLKLALTHRSYGKNNNERLEFLGDSLLNCIISRRLYAQFPLVKEGVLSQFRSSLVKGKNLAVVAKQINLSEYLILGVGERKSGGSQRHSILADTVEAIIGAIYADSNMEQCELFIDKVFSDQLNALSVNKSLKDPKTRLQELLQSKKMPLPVYTIIDVEGLSHQQAFTVTCQTALTEHVAEATAQNRREAEQLAAEKILNLMEDK